MFFGWNSRKQTTAPPLDRRQSLAGVPVVNDGVTIDRSDDQGWVLEVVTRRRQGLVSRFLPATFAKRVELDELGTFVVRQIDGQRSVKAIVDAFREAFEVNRREAELCVADFLKSLIHRRVISMVIE